MVGCGPRVYGNRPGNPRSRSYFSMSSALGRPTSAGGQDVGDGDPGIRVELRALQGTFRNRPRQVLLAPPLLLGLQPGGRILVLRMSHEGEITRDPPTDQQRARGRVHRARKPPGDRVSP